MKLHDFPRYPLTFGPSPVHQLDRLTNHLGGATIWAKTPDAINCGNCKPCRDKLMAVYER